MYILLQTVTSSLSKVCFRPKRSTTDAAYVLRTVVDEYHSQNKKVYACFVDFKAAFDSVNRQLLLHKFNSIGVGGNFLHIIKDMYMNVTSCVKVSPKLRTAFFDVPLGVRQGCTLSPTLFSCFVNDFPDRLLECANINSTKIGDVPIPCLLYADDLVLLSESADGLQNALRVLEKFCFDWQLTVNSTKTKILIFSKARRAATVQPFIYCGEPLEHEKEYVYLGISFVSSGLFNVAQANLASKATKAYYALRACFGNNMHSCVRLFLQLFDCLVVPVALYGCEVWLHPNVEKRETTLGFEKLHLLACKNVLAVNRKTVNYACLGELARFPLWITAKRRVLNFWSRLLRSESLTSQIYATTKTSNHCRAWIRSVKSILNGTGLSELFINESVLSKSDVKTIGHILEDQFQQRWQSVVSGRTRLTNQGDSKLRTYAKFKLSFELEPYLTSKYFRADEKQAIARLRTSNHKLAIETGRHTVPFTPRDRRICLQCNTGSVEDEIHFLLHCTAHSNNRNHLFTEVSTFFPGFRFLSDVDKLIV